MASPRSESNIRLLVIGWLLTGLAFGLVALDDGVTGGLRTGAELQALAQKPADPVASAVADTSTGCTAPALGTGGASCPAEGKGRTAASVSPGAKRAVERHCSPSASALYCFYTVTRGDSLSEIAESFGLKSGPVSATDLLVFSNSATISNAQSIIVGQDLRIPTRQGVVVTVGDGDTLDAIAASYGVSTIEIAAIDGNHLASSQVVKAGQDLLVPNPRQVPRSSAATVAADPSEKSQ